ncbi:MAG: ZmpA/ZmpB/ZmpC family metallo-endopeptidase [Gemella sp.]|nr:ZmpA/ZmpB/ZmpC family metallo-endopeptidase [Gemella sp.]
MNKNINKIYKYSIRKFKVGVGSAIVGLGLVFAGQETFANEDKSIAKQEVTTPVQTQVIVSQVVAPKVAVEAPVVAETPKVQVPSPEVKPTIEANQAVSQLLVKEQSNETTVEEKITQQPEIAKQEVTSERVEAPTVKEAEIAESVVVKPTEGAGFRNAGASTQIQNDVYTAVAADLKAIELNTSTEIATQLAPARISGIDVINKRLEISRNTGRNFQTVTDTEATNAIKAEAIGKLNLDAAFTEAKTDLEKLVKGAVGDVVNLAPQTTSQTLIDKIRANKEQLLLGAAYINKYYDLQFGGLNTKDMLKTNPSFYGGRERQSALDFLIALGSQNYQEMGVTNTVNTYNKLFLNKVSDKPTIPEFLEYNNRINNTGKSIQDWFVGETKAHISEVKSQEANKQDSKYRIYDRLKDATHLHYNILPLLAVSENSLYALSNTAGITFGIVDAYVNKAADPNTQATQLNEFKINLEKANRTQQNFIDFWYRIAKPETHKFLEEPTMTVDTLLKRTDQVGGDPRNRWSAQSEDSAALGVKEFIAPMGLYANYIQVGGEAAGNTVRLYLTKALETNGLTTYAHELTHIYEDKVWMAQGVRDGLQVEFYARGLYEPYQYFNDPYFNINTMFDIEGANANGLYNQSPRRFENPEDLKEYMSGTFDVLYTLDLLEADTILAKSDADKKWWFNQIKMADTRYSQAGYTHKSNEVVALDDATAAKLKSVDDLVDNDIIAERTQLKGFNRVGKFENNDYYSVPMFSSNYAALANDKGVSGDYQTRRMAYELLAHYGYYEGMVPYISNQYKNDATAAGQVLSDKFILGKIFNGEFTDVKDFKKEMFEIRKNKLEKLKPVTIAYNGQTHTIDSLDKLKELFKEAVDADLRTKPSVDSAFAYRVRNVELLKDAIYKAYSKQTAEFRDSIYREPLADTNEPTTAPVKATWTNGYVAPAEEVVKNAVAIDNKLIKSKVLVPAESTQSEVTVLVTYTDGSTDKVKVPVSIDPVTKQEVIARSTRFERNDNLDFGQRETVPGKDGSFENVYTYVLENGHFVEKVSKRNEVAAVDDLIKVGTKPKVETTILPSKIVYEADEKTSLGVETRADGKDGQVVTTTTYSLDLKTGVVSANPPQTTRVGPIDGIVSLGTKPTEKISIIFPVTTYQADETKDFGTEEVKVEGFSGEEISVTTYTVNSQTGEITANPPKVTRREAVDRVIVKGTKPEAGGVVSIPHVVAIVHTSDLKLGETQKVEGQDGMIELLTFYTLDSKSGEITAREVRNVIKEKIDGKLFIGTLETAKGTSITSEELPQLQIEGKPVFEKGTSVSEQEKPRLDLPKVEIAKGDSLKQEALEEIIIANGKGSSVSEQEKPGLELPKVETAKGDSLKQEALEEILIANGKGSSVSEQEKSVLELPKVETAKGDSLKQEVLEEIIIANGKGSSVSEQEKPVLELPKVETAKGQSLTLGALKEIRIHNAKGQSLLQGEKPKVELVKTSYAKQEENKTVLEKIERLENRVLKENGTSALPKTSSVGKENNLSIPLVLSSMLLSASLIQNRRRKNN